MDSPVHLYSNAALQVGGVQGSSDTKLELVWVGVRMMGVLEGKGCKMIGTGR